MAIPDHLKLIQQGVEGWNAWRIKNPDTLPDLAESDLDEQNLFEARLEHADLRDASMKTVDLRESDLACADLSGADLSKANLSKARCVGAVFAQIKGRNARLRGAKFREATMSDADLQDTDLTGADLTYANLSRADLRRADLSGANLSYADLSQCRMDEATLHFTFFTMDNARQAKEGGAVFSVLSEFKNAHQDDCLVVSSVQTVKPPVEKPEENRPPVDRSEEWVEILRKAGIPQKNVTTERPEKGRSPWRRCISGLKRWRKMLFLSAVFFSVVSAAVFAQSDDSLTPSVPIPRLEASVTVDGALTEEVWEQAATLSGFWQYMPVDDRRSSEDTEVLVWYSPTAIHFGIRAYAGPETIRATLADRDKIQGDDYLLLLLDTYNDRRQAFVLGINPLGIQADGILRDMSRRASMLSAGARGAYMIDLNPDFVYESKGRLTSYGYEVEVQVPFKSLRYQALPSQDWGFNVIRKVQHSGHEHTWSRVLQSNASFLSQNGTLTGLNNISRGLVLDLNPEVTSGIEGAAAGNDWKYGGGQPEVGGNVRWGVTNNLTLNATVNPDFSQVEADVAQLQYDPRRAVYFPEKRPFFLDGIEFFQMANQLIYTRRVADPVGAVKLTGKISGTNVALMSGIDAKSTSMTGMDNRFFNLVRLRRDLKGQSTLGIGYTDKMDGENYNRVISADGRLVFGGRYVATFQGASSFTRIGDESTTAPLWNLTFNQEGRTFGFNSGIRGIHPDFHAQSGFIRRTGIVMANFTPRITRFGREGGRLESWTGSIVLDGTWDYERFTDLKFANDARFHLNSAFVLKGGWQASASLLIESFKYPPELYSNYFIERREGNTVVDTVRFTGTDRFSNFDLVGVLATPNFQKFSGTVSVIVGRDENFYEWAPANIFMITFSTNWRPTEQLRINFRYNHQQYIRYDDWSTVGIRRVPRLKIEYQLTRSIFVRFVGQYDANFQDDLRDNSRTDDPILLYNAGTDTYVRAKGYTWNDFRVDWLFSYRPNPGTVFFFGYGSSLDEPESFRFRRLERIADGFFIKLSYLFRV